MDSVPVFEPYFLMWDSVLFQPHGSHEQYPMYVHKTCRQGYRTKSKFPVKICPNCGVDTSTETPPEGIILA